MSGWIKLEKDLETDPRVMRMGRSLCRLFKLFETDVAGERGNACALPGVTLVCGALARLWIFADSHIRDDDTLDMSDVEINDLLGIPGFCALMPEDWLRVIDTHTVELPGFQEHNGVEAKKRALTQKRVTHHREKQQRDSVTGRNALALPDQTRPDHSSPLRGAPVADATLRLDPPQGANGHRSPFERWWGEYPKKAKKRDALKVWKSRKLDGKADALVADVKTRAANDRRWLDGFVPDPPTYLRGERWNDAIEPVAAKSNGNGSEAAAKDRATIANLARDLGIEQQGGEEYPAYRARIVAANERRLAALKGPP